ncbi:MAG: glycine zipper 2TM domain-containing protein [Nitrospinota bacterium]|nr:glycine zipper 2TM domain-containing protein [Nitrospinota bacterium]
MRHIALFAAMLAAAAISTGCAVVPARPDSPSMGALMGAGAGAVIGHQYGRGGRDKGALIGGVLGYTTGLFYEQREREINSGRRDTYYQPKARRGNAPKYQEPRRDDGYYYPEEGYYYSPRR